MHCVPILAAVRRNYIRNLRVVGTPRVRVQSARERESLHGRGRDCSLPACVCSLRGCAHPVRARMQLLPSARVRSWCVCAQTHGARADATIALRARAQPVRVCTAAARAAATIALRVRAAVACGCVHCYRHSRRERGRQTQQVPSACVRSLCVRVRPVRARTQLLPSARVRNRRAGEGGRGEATIPVAAVSTTHVEQTRT